jgi:hypothetical protein
MSLIAVCKARHNQIGDDKLLIARKVDPRRPQAPSALPCRQRRRSPLPIFAARTRQAGIMDAAFTASDSGDPRGIPGRPGAGRLSDASSQEKTPLASADLCRANSASADALIERIERAVGPNASQRDTLEPLRRALAQAIERIAAACPAAMPTTVAERLKAIQDRIWAMHDALLTIRLPFETFYNSLTDELRQRLRREELESARLAAGATEGRGHTVVDRRFKVRLSS